MQITAKVCAGCWKYGFKTCGVLLPPPKSSNIINITKLMNHMQITAKVCAGCWKYGFKTCVLLPPPKNLIYNIYLDIKC
jgi:hypothetical protein